MIDRARLLGDLQRVLRTLETDLVERSESGDVPEVRETLRRDYAAAKEAERTAQNWEDWRSDYATQMAAAWVLSCVFARFLEDNGLVDPPRLAGPGERLRRARDEHELYFRSHPTLTDREYLLDVFDGLRRLPGGDGLFGEYNPIRELPNWLSGDAAGELLRFFQRVDANTGGLVHDFTDSAWDTRFLGDLYQDLSEAARKKYALLQTPEFVEEFILDRTLDPALDEFELDASAVKNAEGEEVAPAGFRMIDPACGSGHFLLGAFRRILDRWQKREPGTNVRELARRSLESVYGVDLNPYAAAIARFRLLLAAMRACGVTRLADAPDFRPHVYVGDSLLHGSGEQLSLGWRDYDHAYHGEDAAALRRVLRDGRYHAVVANPPYITPKDSALGAAYRERYTSCHRQYSLAVPFLERIFRLAVPDGFTGQITANSFMKREFGKKLIEDYLPRIDLTHVVDTSGAYIPGHGTPTVILFGRSRRPISRTIRTVMAIRGEPTAPADPAVGHVWIAIRSQLDLPGSCGEFVSVDDVARDGFSKHPWSLGGGGAAELKQLIDSRSVTVLRDVVDAAGIASWAGIDEAFVIDGATSRRRRWSRALTGTFVTGDTIRDWRVVPDEVALSPHLDDRSLASRDELKGAFKDLWMSRTLLESRVLIDGRTIKQHGIPFYSWVRWIDGRYASPNRIAFAFIATHNHFMLDGGGRIFNRSAPVITKDDAREEWWLTLLGLLNSSTACFWMKQVFYPKTTANRDVDTETGRPEANRYEIAVTGLERFPIPYPIESPEWQNLIGIARAIESLAERIERALPAAVIREWNRRGGDDRLREMLSASELEHGDVIRRMVALQEELDWEVYRIFGLEREGAASFVLCEEAGIESETRPFLWQSDALPASVPGALHSLYSRRRSALKTDPNLSTIETLVFKRPWWGRQGVYGRLSRDYAGWTREALQRWLLDRLEGYFDADGRMREGVTSRQRSRAGIGEAIDYLQPAPDPSASPLAGIALISVSRLADVAGQDERFLEVGAVYRYDPAFDVPLLVAELAEAESVPHLPVLRYKESGHRKRAEWERTWNLQRQEDAIDALTKLPPDDPRHISEVDAADQKRREVGDIPVPPKYTSADFLKSSYWGLRGKLDVPKERWISFPYCEGPDGSLMIAWAGYDHLQLAKAIGDYYSKVQTELGGSDDPRLVPLLASLIELLPWLKQWHNEVDPEFGLPMGDYFEGFVQDEARQMGKTLDEIRAWMPPARPARRGKAKRS